MKEKERKEIEELIANKDKESCRNCAHSHYIAGENYCSATLQIREDQRCNRYEKNK